MGTWGTGLYQSDYARDLKDTIIEWLGLEMTPEEIVSGLRTEQGLGDWPETVNDCAFWLVLADQFHRHGIDVTEVHTRADRIIRDGIDIAFHAELGLSAANQAKRAAALEKLRLAWSSPARRPAKRRILKPEPQLLRTGDLFAYPTMEGNPRLEPLGQHAKATYAFEPDAQNAFVVLGEARYFHDMFARAFIAPLALFHEHAIEIGDCMAAPFLCEVSFSYRTFKPLGGWVTMDARDLKRIGAVRLTRLEIDPAAATGIFGDALQPPATRFQMAIDPLQVNIGFQSSIARGWIWGDGSQTLGTITA